MLQRPRPSTPTVHVPAAATAAVVTLAAATGKRHHVTAIVWSYSAAPTGGRLTVAFGATTVLDITITAAGPGSLSFPSPLRNPDANEAVTVTLASGAGAVEGKVTVLAYEDA